MDIQAADLVTIGVLIALEGVLSADNALVMAIMVLGLPRREHQRALRYGLVGAFALRVIATFLAVYLIRLAVAKLLGGAYLLYLSYQHFGGGASAEERRTPPKALPWLGLSPFWATIVRVELVNLAFSIDSILVAVAVSPKLLVVLTGGLLGIVALRLVVGQLLNLIQRYPAIVDGAFVIIAWIAIKLMLEFLADVGWIHFEVPRWLSLGLIAVIFAISLLYARMQGAVPLPTDNETDGMGRTCMAGLEEEHGSQRNTSMLTTESTATNTADGRKLL